MPDEQIETPTSAPATDVAVETPAAAEAPAAPEAASAEGTPSYWADDWRERLAGSNEEELKQLRRYASPEGIWKKARQLEKRLSSGEFKRAKPDTQDEAVLAAWRAENGVPDTVKGYVDSLPADLDIAEEDFPALTRIFEKMHASGTAAAEATAVVQEYYAMRAEALEKQAAGDRQYRVQAEDELRGEWGLDFRPNMDAIGMLVEAHGDKEAFAKIGSARLDDGSRLGDNPVMLRFLANVARELYGDSLIAITPQGGLNSSNSIADEMRALELEMQDTHGRDPAGYWKNPQKQARYATLLEAQERQARRNR